MAAPTLAITGTPSESQFAANQSSPLGWVNAANKRSGRAARIRAAKASSFVHVQLTKWRALETNHL